MGRRRRRRKIAVCLMKGDRVPRNYFIIPNAIFEKDLSTEALVTLMYLLLHQKAEVSMEHLCAVLSRKEESVKKYLQELKERGITYPYQDLKVSRNFFMLPKIIFDLGLSIGALATYAYLMKCENRETYQCWPSHTTIGENIGRSRGSVIKDVRELVTKRLIYSEPSLPKFDVVNEMDLIEGMKAMGVTDIFDSTVSDFTPMTDTPMLYVSQISHAARVTIDEKGCTAAAFAVINIGPGGMPSPELDEIDFVLDRPFLFIVSSRDNLPLFAGVVNEP